MNEDLIFIGNRIREERKAQNLSQECLAEDIAMKPANLSKIENGASAVRLDRFIAICDALSISPDKLFPERFTTGSDSQDDYSNISHRLALLSDDKRGEALQAIDMILRLAGC